MSQGFILLTRIFWGIAAAIGGAGVGLWTADKMGIFETPARQSQSVSPMQIDIRLAAPRIDPFTPPHPPLSPPTGFKPESPLSSLVAAENTANQILISVTDRRLRLILADGSAHNFPIAVGHSRKLIPIGLTEVVGKRRNPTWTPTPNMRRKNPNLPAAIPPGPDNPMGNYALDLGWTYYRIHGTNDPQSIGRAVSSGCFRMLPDDIRTLFNHVEIGAKVRVIEGPLPKVSTTSLI